MKRWSGGTLILSLALLLALSYTIFVSTSTTNRSSGESRSPPHILASLPGLTSLFPPPPSLSNSSTLAWALMASLLARSDALPSTSDGIAEAAAAIEELAAAIDAESREKAAPPSAMDSGERRCPSSVAGNGGFLEIPCGFVENSAVTIVGIPIGINGTTTSFAVQLIGSSPSRGIAPPIVLNLNVSLGDGKLRRSVVSQNAWEPKEGWGQWEDCPDLQPNISIRVDGLVRCNAWMVERGVSAGEGGNRSTDTPPRETSHRIAGFPFANGQTFTATMWVGMEGFHLTVNGRHETSFSYRERLEPWSVAGVKLSGDIKILSCIANGLPVSEEYDPAAADLDMFIAPPIPKRRLHMLVGVFSVANNFELRMALRRSWMQYEAIRAGDVAVRFFIGLHKNTQVNLEIRKEAQTYGDIQMMPFVDYYSLITLKTIAIYILGTKILPAKYIMKTDDDAFVRIDEVLSGLKKGPSHGLLYGLISYNSSPHRDPESKWYISSEEWASGMYPPWAHGPGYVVSRDVAEFVVQGHYERSLRSTLQLFKLEDVAVGIWVKEFQRTGRRVRYASDDRFHNAGCEPGYVLAHYQRPRMLLCLWETLQKETGAICCE